ncbi:MAG TPA: DUF5681 domain-containing protein [Vicinamibacterales bacterium]
MANPKRKDHDAVGYRKPPRATRFQKGRSGNPKGRPKGTRNLKTDLAEELQTKIIVSEAGVRRNISKQRAVVKSLIAKALRGEAKAIHQLVELVLRLMPQDQGADAIDPLSADDLAIIAMHEERVRRRLQASGSKTHEA